MSVTKNIFGNMPDGRQVDSYTLTNARGTSVTILTLGGIVQSLITLDKNKEPADIACGFDTVEDYLSDTSYQGAIIGRFGNRIAGGKFTLNGKEYTLFCNNGANHLHGGKVGFNQKLWDASYVESDKFDSLTLTITSPDGEEGYPGTLDMTVTYTLGADNGLTIHYSAVTDADTVFNPTNHTYFNLSCYNGGDVANTELQISASKYIASGKDLIPVGDPVCVEGTDYDFRCARPIKNLYDNTFVRDDKGFKKSAEAYSPESGRTLTVYTDQPGVHLYTAGSMNGAINFKAGVPQRPFHAFCIETQHYPNTPNRPDYPSCVLKKGEKYDSFTKFVFGTK